MNTLLELKVIRKIESQLTQMRGLISDHYSNSINLIQNQNQFKVIEK